MQAFFAEVDAKFVDSVALAALDLVILDELVVGGVVGLASLAFRWHYCQPTGFSFNHFDLVLLHCRCATL